MTTQGFTDQELFALLDEMQREADASQERSQFGKFTYAIRYFQWADSKTVDADPETWRNLGKEERGMEFMFMVDIQEFNPSLEFTYERKVTFRSTDWFKIVWPALQAATGEKELSKALEKLSGSYVEALDVLQAPTKKKPNPEYKTIKLNRLFTSREECYVAWAEKFGKTGEMPAASAQIEIPEGGVWTAESWPGIFPDFKKACDEANTKPESVRKALATKIANDYSVSDTFVSKFVLPF